MPRNATDDYWVVSLQRWQGGKRIGETFYQDPKGTKGEARQVLAAELKTLPYMTCIKVEHSRATKDSATVYGETENGLERWEYQVERIAAGLAGILKHNQGREC
jgi:hypothetical protein